MKKAVMITILVVLVVILVGAAGYITLRKSTTEKINSTVNNERATQALPTSQLSTSEWKVYTGNNFSVKYPANIFTVFDVRKYSAPQNKVNSNQIKLISSLRAGNLGKKECVYHSKFNSKQICEVVWESGISFNETDGPIADYTSFIENKTSITIGEKQFTKTSINLDVGEMEIYYISLGSNRTLIVSRQVQAVYDSQRQDGFPQESLFNQVLSTLVIK